YRGCRTQKLPGNDLASRATWQSINKCDHAQCKCLGSCLQFSWGHRLSDRQSSIENRQSYDPAVLQLDDAVAVGRVRLRVRHLDNSCAFAVEPLEKLHDFPRLIRMQVARRLVGQDQFR